MSEAVQTQVASPTAPAAAAGVTPATTTPAAAPVKGTLLAGDPAVEKKPEGEATASGENKTTPEAAAALKVNVPDGFTADPKFTEAVAGWAKESGVKQEALDKLVTQYAAQRASEAKSLEASMVKQSDEWMTELKADKDVGGEKFASSTAHARAAVLKFGGSQAVEVFNHPAIGNHPVLFKMMAAIGAAMAEDTSTVKSLPGGRVEMTEAERTKLRYSPGFKAG
jgi:hypothetical protein